MSPEACDWIERAMQVLSSAELLADSDPDASASRAYYAAFYAVSALFSAEGKSFRKHSAVEAAVHRDLVREGRWPPELGEAYTRLQLRRLTNIIGHSTSSSFCVRFNHFQNEVIMKRLASMFGMLLLVASFGCAKEEKKDDLATRTGEAVGKAKEKAEDLQQEENERVEEVNEAMEE